ncbi:uncharacterized protein LOC119669867 [Teleopsis dalmanni]|uniref:uncharacterized protein LOC119669867 n=1 Tax=Teleopsis dalmanni TaxID=139649 RepID=UPI0018CCF373|nr:uncharacterized protein LOC119669867 [Teleopsis dalmanni]
MPVLPTIEEEDKPTLLRSMWKYRLQFQALSAASFVFIAGGMKLAWSIFESPSGKFLSNFATHQLTISWFLGVLLGAILAATFVQRVSKNVAHCISGALLIFGGINFILVPTYFTAVVSSCICEGCAYGLTIVQALVTGGEIGERHIRGLLLSCERIFLWLGICLQLLYTRLWFKFEPPNGYTLHIDQLHGIAIAFLGLFAILMTLLHRIESPLLLQMQHRDLVATQALKRLQGENYPNTDILRIREDCKQLLVYDAGQAGCANFCKKNLLTLFKVVLVRCYATISLSLLFNRAFLSVSWHGLGCDINCLYLLAIFGLLGSITGGLIIDQQGRRKLSVISLLLGAIFIFIVGGIFEHVEDLQHITQHLVLELAAYLMFAYQFITCTGIALASSVYTAEAFTLTVKSKCISSVIVCEQLLQLSLAIIAFNINYKTSIFFFSLGSLGLLLGLLVFFFMPETKFLMLSECLQKFKSVVY